MMRLILRLLALAFLSVAVIMAVLDATRTIASSTLVLTPLAESWGWASPSTLRAAGEFVRATIHPLAWDPLAQAVLALPGWVVFLLLAFLAHALGYRRERAIGSPAT